MNKVGLPNAREYCSPLQALLWGYLDNHFKNGTNPFENYQDAYYFILPIWGPMEGERWSDFDNVVARLSSPQLLNHWQQKKLNYEYYISDKRSPREVFMEKLANCKDTSKLTRYCLERMGYKYNSGMIYVRSFDPRGHVIAYYKDNGKIYIIDNGTRNPLGIRGPFDSMQSIPYTIIRHYD